jgi:osmotically inducible lipoprotein OsmB
MRTSLVMAAAALTLATAGTAEARRCGNRLTKTEGAVVGAVGGAILGGVLTHGSTGPLVGAAGGGIAGHEIARGNNNRNCRKYYRRSRR